MSKNNKLLLPAEVADRLRMSRDTLISWGNHGKGPFYYEYHNGARRYPVDSVEEWLAEQGAEHMRNREGVK